MESLKIQVEILRAAYKRDNLIGKKNFTYLCCELPKSYAITEGHAIKLIDKDACLIDMHKIFELDTNKYKFSMKESWLDHLDAKYLEYVHSIKKDKDTIVCLKDEAGNMIYINQKYVNPYNPEWLVFRQGEEKHLVHLEDEFGSYFGCVCGIKGFKE